MHLWMSICVSMQANMKPVEPPKFQVGNGKPVAGGLLHQSITAAASKSSRRRRRRRRKQRERLVRVEVRVIMRMGFLTMGVIIRVSDSEDGTVRVVKVQACEWN